LSGISAESERHFWPANSRRRILIIDLVGRNWVYPKLKQLAHISHQVSTAEADPGMSTALRSVGLLDILSSLSAGPSVALAEKLPDAPCIHDRLRLRATKPGEECGLSEPRRRSANLTLKNSASDSKHNKWKMLCFPFAIFYFPLIRQYDYK
jgi:hypothetical protein